MGAGFAKVKANEPVLVDLVHLHRGYVVDMTRMFVAGRMPEVWEERLEDMIAVRTLWSTCSTAVKLGQAWQEGFALAEEMGHADHLMGMAPDQIPLPRPFGRSPAR
ncbi:MAG: hypothetical protein CM15mP18_0720 [Methanobacteriota archaeon]|nr:MAG: hypothetical protein CM15mP18_0720 [Euryarchaeota archaeon]